MRFTIEEVTGGPAAVLGALADDPQFKNTRNLNPVVAMTMARNVAQQLALSFLRGLVETAIGDTYDLYVLTNGEHKDCADRAARDNWEAGIDDAVEAVLLPYEKSVSADWFGRHAIDTRLHEIVGEQHAMATSFAKEVWKVITHAIRDEGGEKNVVELTTAEILAACGVSKSDVVALLAERPEPTVQQETTHTMSNFNETAAKLKEFIEMAGMGEKDAIALLENALDTDEGIAASGITQLGGELADCEALRAFVAKLNSDAPADDLYDVIMTGDIPALADTDESVKNDASLGVDAEAAALAEMMGGAAPPQAGAGHVPPPPLPLSGGPPPKATTRKPRGGAGTPVAGAIPARAFELIRAHVKVKDEDVGSMLGVSRQTFVNYGKGRPAFVPSADQKAALLTMVETHLKGLQEAQAIIAAI